jgi:zinc protease
MKRLFALAAALALLGACGSAPAPEEGRIFPYDTQVRDLPNGLRAVTVKTPYPNIVALYVVVQVGSRNEVEPGRSGFAHLFEHMMFRGTKRFPPEKWNEIMQAAGAETNAYTTDDRTVYHAVFSKEDLEPILDLEADRFQNLEYSEEIFRTETRAVLGEFNKNFADPMEKLEEQLRDKAFTTHTYKHTTMGFVQDVENMPEMYDYGLQFFDRYYRPEYTVVSIVGDIEHGQAQSLIEKYWGGWEKGTYKAPIPAEPPQTAPQTIDVDFHAPTLPLLAVAYHAPAYSDQIPDSAVLDVISFQAFGENSDIYKRLVLEQQKVDVLFPGYYDHADPYLFSIIARVKKQEDVADVQSQILAEIEKLKNEPVAADKLEDVKSHLRYQFALSMDSTSAIAETLAHYLGLTRDPETINRRYQLYQQVTPQAVQDVAKRVFVDTGRTIATLETAGEGGKSE